MDQLTIARLCLECQTHFETLETYDGENRLSSTTVEDELGRFRMWASNIGALNTGRASLDYRLRDANYLYETVKSLLEDLKRSLSEGFTCPDFYFLT
jgi:hypothetical protein